MNAKGENAVRMNNLFDRRKKSTRRKPISTNPLNDGTNYNVELSKFLLPPSSRISTQTQQGWDAEAPLMEFSKINQLLSKTIHATQNGSSLIQLSGWTRVKMVYAVVHLSISSQLSYLVVTELSVLPYYLNKFDSFTD